MPYKIFIITGEASGDYLAANIVEALSRLNPLIEFQGVGGYYMEKSGISSLFPLSDINVMGLFDVLPKLKIILKRIHFTRQKILDFSPDLILTIDAPDFCFRVTKPLRKILSVPIVHCVAPSVWVWRKNRAKKYAKQLDLLLTLLPMEPPYFRKYGLKTEFIGHPLLETPPDHHHKEVFLKKYRLSDKTLLLCLLPGSRASEIKRLMPLFYKIFVNIRAHHPHFKVVLPTFKEYATYLQQTYPDILVVPQEDKIAAMMCSTIALAASGTVSLELALTKTPAIIAYKFNFFTNLFARLFLPLTNFTYDYIINILLKN